MLGFNSLEDGLDRTEKVVDIIYRIIDKNDYLIVIFYCL